MGKVRLVGPLLAATLVLAVGCVRDKALEQFDLAPGGALGSRLDIRGVADLSGSDRLAEIVRMPDARDGEVERDLVEAVDAGADGAEVSDLVVVWDLVEVSDLEVVWDLVEVSDLEVVCVADCAGKECGDDGCGGVCGECLLETGGCEGLQFFPGSECSDGVCLVLPNLNCDDSIDCTADTCDPVVGCVNQPDDAPCDDGQQCTWNTCEEGVGCVYLNVEGQCDDGDVCTEGDECIDGNCIAGFFVCSEDCANGEDDDMDELVDCADPDCLAAQCSGWGKCFDGQCCMPDCVDNQCGEDGCGGFCGGCNPGQVCLAEKCAQWVPEESFKTMLIADHDTYATHNDQTVHGSEAAIKVGVEPQECSNDGWNPCPDDDEVCCEVDWTYNFCAPDGECEATDDPTWSAHRKFRGYIRFDVTGLPEGKVVSADLALHEAGKVEKMGGPVKIVIARLKHIGISEPICEWDEDVLNDTNGTTWNSLPQSLSITEDGAWSYDVTKAVVAWLEGDPDVPGSLPQTNCGFNLYDPDFGSPEAPIQRWILFSSKEGGFPPLLGIAIAQDLDDDGVFGDCDEEDPTVHPGATEICDGIDNDCNGMTDDEVCDAVDNDCDGAVDEGESLCGAGMMCIYHQCMVTCDDECGGSLDAKCVQGEDGVWERWGCASDVDTDPCFEWHKLEECGAGQHCLFGFCSNNCLDLCAVEGEQECEKDAAGKWHVGTCGDWDGDGCLELGELEFCGPGASCTDGVCGSPCIDQCPVLGEVSCKDDQIVQACFDSDNNGCLEWTEVDDCGAFGKNCSSGECQ